jgi:CheY-like chemotaxis protein
MSVFLLVSVNQLLESKAVGEEIGAAAVLARPVRADRLVKCFTGQLKDALDPAATEVKFKDLKVLITEDNPVNQKIAERMFSSLGCQVQLASNGAEAIDMAKIHAFDVIFMDLHMPEMDGFEATRGILSMRQARGEIPIPVVALTAKVMPEDRDACLNAGMTDYLSKPISRLKLMDFLSRMFPEKMEKK